MLFEWPLKTSPRLSLPLFILLAALLHLSTIFIFNIVYQPTHVTKPIAAQILFLLPGSPASLQLSSWLQANDSSIFSPLKTAESVRRNVDPDIYQTHHSVPLPLHPLPLQESQTIEPPLPSASNPSVISSENTQPISDEPQTEQGTQRKITTVVHFLNGLSERVPNHPFTPPLTPDSISTPLPPTELTLNIDAAGIPRHAIIFHSSGNPLADETATRWAMSQHFTPSSHDSWGHLLILWGKNRIPKINTETHSDLDLNP